MRGLRLIIFLSIILMAPSLSAQQVFERVSENSSGGWGDENSYRASVSEDGRYVAFRSFASNLVPGDTNGQADIFVKDRQTGRTTRISVASDGTEANGRSDHPKISGNGRFVVFTSEATNLVTGDTNEAHDVFVHDRETGETRRISVTSYGEQILGGYPLAQDFNPPDISRDGLTVAFASLAPNLAPEIPSGNEGVFVHDLTTGETTLVSITSEGQVMAAGEISGLSLSADGRHVAFASRFPAYLAETDQDYDIFIHDRQMLTTEAVGNASEEGLVAHINPDLSEDGQIVTFVQATRTDRQVMVYDRYLPTYALFFGDPGWGEASLVSRSILGSSGNGSSDFPSLSDDGRFIAFLSDASDLVLGDTNAAEDLFVFDYGWTGQTERIPLPTGYSSQGNELQSTEVSISTVKVRRHGRTVLSGDGGMIVFESYASNLSDPILEDPNRSLDVFAVPNPRAPLPPPASVSATPGPGLVRIKWAPIPWAIGYKVYWGLDPDEIGPSNPSVYVSGGGSTQTTFSGLTNGQRYNYKVSAVSALEESPLSPAVSALPFVLTGGTSNGFGPPEGQSTPGTDDGMDPRFNTPKGSCISPDGTKLFVMEYNDHTIRQIVLKDPPPAGNELLASNVQPASTVGLTSTVAGFVGRPGSQDGVGENALFNSPTACATDGTYLYVSDAGNNLLRRVTVATGEVTAFVFDDFSVQLKQPMGLTVDHRGVVLYVADSGNHVIRRINMETGETAIVAGAVGIAGNLDGFAGESRLNGPVGLAIDSTDQSLYVADFNNSYVRKVDLTTGQVTKVAGCGAQIHLDGVGVDKACFQRPNFLAIDPTDTLLYVTDYAGHTVRRLHLGTGELSTLAGTPGTAGDLNGIGTGQSKFSAPMGISVCDDGRTLCVTDMNNRKIRTVE